MALHNTSTPAQLCQWGDRGELPSPVLPVTSVYFAECGLRNFDHVYFVEILMRNVPQIIRCSNSAFRKILFHDRPMQGKTRSSLTELNSVCPKSNVYPKLIGLPSNSLKSHCAASLFE